MMISQAGFDEKTVKICLAQVTQLAWVQTI